MSLPPKFSKECSNQIAEQLGNILSRQQPKNDNSPTTNFESKSPSEIKVYAVLTITVLLMILTLANGTEYQGFAFRVAIIGMFLSISWWVADRFCVARRVMKQVRKL